MELGDTDNMMELHNKLWGSTFTQQHPNIPTCSLFTFLMKVCFDPIIYFSMTYATIWYFLSVNSQLVFTPSLPMDQHRPLISTYPPNIWSGSPRFYFCNLVPIQCTSIIPIHETYFFPNMVLNTIIKFKTNLSILDNTITKFILPNCHARKTLTTQVRFLYILQLWFTQVTQLSAYFSKKELPWMFSFNKFFLLITSPTVLSWQVHLGAALPTNTTHNENNHYSKHHNNHHLTSLVMSKHAQNIYIFFLKWLVAKRHKIARIIGDKGL